MGLVDHLFGGLGMHEPLIVVLFFLLGKSLCDGSDVLQELLRFSLVVLDLAKFLTGLLDFSLLDQLLFRGLLFT